MIPEHGALDAAIAQISKAADNRALIDEYRRETLRRN